MTHAFDILLCLMILAVSGAAIMGRDLFVSIALFVIYGLLLAIAWVRLDAIDVALAEAAIGAGLSGILLLRGLSEVRDSTAKRALRAPLTILLGTSVAAAVGWAVSDLVERELGLQQRVGEHLAASGVANPVTAVLLNFRGWDTLLESIVLLAALAGVWAVSPGRGALGRPHVHRHLAGEDVLSTFGRFLAPLGFVVGAYVVWTGSSAPGGAFQAGTVLAAVWLLTMMAKLSSPPAISDLRLRTALIIGPLLFLAVGSTGLLAGAFFSFPAPHAGVMIVAIELVLAVSIAATLAMLVLGTPRSAP